MRKANSTFSCNVLSWLAALVVTFATAVNANAQCTLICNDLVNVSLAEDCELALEPDMILEGGGCPTGILVVEVDRVAPFGNGPWVAGTLTAADLNKTFAVRVRNTIGSGNSCWGMIHVEDKLVPTIVCADISVSCAITEYSPEDLAELGFNQAYPDASDNCYVPTLTHTDQFFDQTCSNPDDLSAYVIRTWRAVDGSGNSSTCQQYIYFERRHPADVDFPADVTIYCDETYAVDNQGHPAVSVTGAPYIDEFGPTIPIYPNNTFCEMNGTYQDQTIPCLPPWNKLSRTALAPSRRSRGETIGAGSASIQPSEPFRTICWRGGLATSAATSPSFASSSRRLESDFEAAKSCQFGLAFSPSFPARKPPSLSANSNRA